MWDTWICGTALWGNEDMYVRDGLHLSGKGAAVFAEGLSVAVASGLGKVRYLIVRFMVKARHIHQMAVVDVNIAESRHSLKFDFR